MQPSTTTTTTTDHWYLDKYSRSRPRPSSEGPQTKRARTGAAAVVAGGGDSVLEWDHYTQPQLHLYLETTSLPSSPPQIKLTITFEPSNQSTQSTHQRLELESLSLTSLSSPAILAQTPLDQLPLKAVFRNTVIGVRYISLGRGAGHDFKRFQAKFVNKHELERFVRAIEGVCPIKPAEEKGGTVGLRRNGTSGNLLAAPSTTSTNPLSSNDATFRRAPPTSSPDDRPLSPAAPTLPARIYSLFPRLAPSLIPPLQPISTIQHDATCEELASLDREAFEGLLEEVLCEEGFGKLAAKVQEALRG